jgi:hypothetical protein
MTQQVKPGDVNEGVDADRLDVADKPAVEVVAAGPDEGSKEAADIAAVSATVSTDVYQGFLLNGRMEKRTILGGIDRFLRREDADDADRGIIDSAVKFIENPTNNLEDVQAHTTDVAMVMAMWPGDAASILEVDAMHAYLLSLQCINRINFVVNNFNNPADYKKVFDAMLLATDEAVTVSEGYEDDTLLKAVDELKARLPMEMQLKLLAHRERMETAIKAR